MVDVGGGFGVLPSLVLVFRRREPHRLQDLAEIRFAELHGCPLLSDDAVAPRGSRPPAPGFWRRPRRRGGDPRPDGGGAGAQRGSATAGQMPCFWPLGADFNRSRAARGADRQAVADYLGRELKRRAIQPR